MGDIAAFSGEQARGIDQVNAAVAEMDRATRGNAAHSGAASSAADVMNDQTDRMKAVAGDLAGLARGGGR